MTVKIIDGITVMYAEPDMWLCNRSERITGVEVWLPSGQTTEGWEDITEAEKDRLEEEWRRDAEEDLLK